jgi:kynurenine formamidase
MTAGKIAFLALISVFLQIFATQTIRAEDKDKDKWWPSPYGADDRIGAANNLSPEIVLKAAKLIKTGKTYSLAVDSGPKTPYDEGRRFQMIVQEWSLTGSPVGKNKVTINDDIVFSSLGVGTQLDGFAHIGIDNVYYNGVKFSDFFFPKGVRQFGTETIPQIVTRGVLLNIAALKGVTQVPPGTPIGKTEIEAAMKRQNVAIEKGDVVLLHTGWLDMGYSDAKRFLTEEPGLNLEGARYLADKGVVAVGADTMAVEVIPWENKEMPLIVHQELLVKRGVYLLEIVDTRALAADNVSEFFFVLGQPKFVGAVQMVVNPIAIR